MKNIIKPLILTSCLMLAACEPSISSNKDSVATSNQALKASSANRVGADTDFVMSVFGAIHGGHRSSTKYSLPVLEKAVRNFKPDVVFIEIPPTSLALAQSTFNEFDEVRERRTLAFPELTDVMFPLQKELDFEMIATAGWSRKLANDRAAVLKRIENDPARSNEWNEHIAARRNLSAIQSGKNDDPLYIHSKQYDEEVKTAQTPYETYFDNDIGAGGWGPINDTHIGLMTQALDELKVNKDEKAVRILVIFGAWHKYKILEAMEKRDDITLIDAKLFFE